MREQDSNINRAIFSLCENQVTHFSVPTPPDTHLSIQCTVMNTYKKQHLEKVLNWAKIHSINDLNAETVGYLTYELEGRVPITTFHIHAEDYRLWRLDHPEIVDVEYDAFTERVIIKATTTVLHDTSLKVFRDWLSDWSEQLTDDEHQDEYHCNTLSSKLNPSMSILNEIC